MEIRDLNANQGDVNLVAEIISKEEPRTFEKFGKVGRVCKATIKDNSGKINLTLWNDDIDKVKIGDKIHLENGWCSEYRGEKQLSVGKFGKLEVLESASEASSFSESAGAEPGPDAEDDFEAAPEEELIE